MYDAETITCYLTRLKRKVEILKLDAKARGQRTDDYHEALSIIERLEEMLG